MNIIDQFLSCVAKMSSLQEENKKKYLEDMSDVERELLIRRLDYLLLSGETIESISQSYLNFRASFLTERKYFVENGTYRYSKYEDAAVIYENVAYMKDYMIGLALGVYMWRIQRDTLRFFREKCILNNKKGGKYLEVGPGHGEYLLTAIENMNYSSYYAVDISQSSVDITNSFISYVYKDEPEIMKKILVERKDFFDLDEEKYDAIVVSEVIEHVENPRDFLAQMKKLAHEDSFIYLSTAINSPFPDHLYHFHNIEEVHDMIKNEGFVIVDQVMSTSENISLEKAIRKNYDITVGFILSVEK